MWSNGFWRGEPTPPGARVARAGAARAGWVPREVALQTLSGALLFAPGGAPSPDLAPCPPAPWGLVAAVVDHRDLVGDAHLGLGRGAVAELVHRPRDLVDRVAQELGVGLQLDELPLDPLVVGERLAEHHPLLGVGDARVDAELRGP